MENGRGCNSQGSRAGHIEGIQGASRLQCNTAMCPDKFYQNDPIPEPDFLAKWRAAVGDTFESAADLKLLLGNYLSNPAPFSTSHAPLMSYFPASELPNDPATRFADLFLTRPRWKADEISPFLSDIVVDNKERDKLLLKYARAITDKDGVWYTARAKMG